VGRVGVVLRLIGVLIRCKFVGGGDVDAEGGHGVWL
jgi:hypothetical protein